VHALAKLPREKSRGRFGVFEYGARPYRASPSSGSTSGAFLRKAIAAFASPPAARSVKNAAAPYAPTFSASAIEIN
jgi:hypothetical protein